MNYEDKIKEAKARIAKYEEDAYTKRYNDWFSTSSLKIVGLEFYIVPESKLQIDNQIAKECWD